VLCATIFGVTVNPSLRKNPSLSASQNGASSVAGKTATVRCVFSSLANAEEAGVVPQPATPSAHCDGMAAAVGVGAGPLVKYVSHAGMIG
jgi:hypothetical protein